MNMKPSGRIYFRDNHYELATYWLLLAQSLSHVRLFVTLWTEDLPGSSVHEDSPGKNTGVGWHFLLQVSSSPKGRTQVSCISCTGRLFLYHCAFWGTRNNFLGQLKFSVTKYCPSYTITLSVTLKNTSQESSRH